MEWLPRPRLTSTLLVLSMLAASVAIAPTAHALRVVYQGFDYALGEHAGRSGGNDSTGGGTANAASAKVVDLGDSIGVTGFAPETPGPRTSLLLWLGLAGLGVAGGRREAFRD